MFLPIFSPLPIRYGSTAIPAMYPSVSSGLVTIFWCPCPPGLKCSYAAIDVATAAAGIPFMSSSFCFGLVFASQFWKLAPLLITSFISTGRSVALFATPSAKFVPLSPALLILLLWSLPCMFILSLYILSCSSVIFLDGVSSYF